METVKALITATKTIELARAALLANRYDTVKTTLEPRLVGLPKIDRFEAYLLLCEACFRAKQEQQLSSASHEALAFAKQALALSEELGRREAKEANLRLGRCYGELGQHSDALQHLFVAEELGETPDARLLTNIGLAHYRLGQLDEAEQFFRQVLEMQLTEDAVRIGAAAQHNLGLVYAKKGDLASAVDAWLKAIELAKQHNHLMAYAFLSDLLNFHVERKEVAFAEAAWRDIETLEIGELLSQAPGMFNYASLLYLRGDLDTAARLLKEAISQFEQEGARFPRHAYLRLYQTYKSQAKYALALEIHEKICQEKTAALNRDYNARTVGLLSKYKYDRVQKEREFYRRETLVLSQDVSQLKEKSQVDALTGLYNRGYFDKVSLELFQNATGSAKQLSLILIDVDHFKQVNDTFSHLIGDEVLRRVANQMRQERRKRDVIARYGGEEFVLLLPDTELSEAVVVAEKMRKAVKYVAWDSVAAGLTVTLSMGVTALAASVQAMLEQADERLYRAKRSGRDQCIWN